MGEYIFAQRLQTQIQRRGGATRAVNKHKWFHVVLAAFEVG